jgi:hypothetical protein
MFSGLRATSRGSVWEEEIHEVFGEDFGGRSGECVHAVHRHLIVDADREDIARGNGLEVDLVMRSHHTEGFLDTQVKARCMRWVTCPLRVRRRLAIELPACTSPSSTPWHASRAVARSSSNSCGEEL